MWPQISVPSGTRCSVVHLAKGLCAFCSNQTAAAIKRRSSDCERKHRWQLFALPARGKLMAGRLSSQLAVHSPERHEQLYLLARLLPAALVADYMFALYRYRSLSLCRPVGQVAGANKCPSATPLSVLTDICSFAAKLSCHWPSRAERAGKQANGQTIRTADRCSLSHSIGRFVGPLIGTQQASMSANSELNEAHLRDSISRHQTRLVPKPLVGALN